MKKKTQVKIILYQAYLSLNLKVMIIEIKKKNNIPTIKPCKTGSFGDVNKSKYIWTQNQDLQFFLTLVPIISIGTF